MATFAQLKAQHTQLIKDRSNLVRGIRQAKRLSSGWKIVVRAVDRTGALSLRIGLFNPKGERQTNLDAVPLDDLAAFVAARKAAADWRDGRTADLIL